MDIIALGVPAWAAGSGSSRGARWAPPLKQIAISSVDTVHDKACSEDLADVRATLQGDEDAYARLVQRYQDVIGAQMWRFTRQHRVLEELVQEVFVEAFCSLGKFRGQAPFVHWLRKVATRVGYRFWKERQRTRRHVSLDKVHSLPCYRNTEISAYEAGEWVHAVLQELPPRDRLVLTYLYLEQLSTAEVAALTNWHPTMVRVQAHRAKKKLKRILESQADG